jgi:hypothetical protein
MWVSSFQFPPPAASAHGVYSRSKESRAETAQIFSTFHLPCIWVGRIAMTGLRFV